MTDNIQGEPIIILLVEDNLDHTELILRSLNDHRIANKVIHLTDGEAALNYLMRRGEYENPDTSPRPHLILLDLRLPKIDGLEVLRQIKLAETIHRIPVVIITTSEADVDVARAYDFRANSYLVKPIGIDKFHELIESLGFYWLGWNKNPWLS